MSMNISQALLPEFDHEMAILRKTLERVPEGQVSFQPHPKSMTLGRLAGHLVEMPAWVLVGIGQSEFHMNPPGGPETERYQLTNRAEAIARFDRDVAAARQALAGASDEVLMQPWTFKKGGHTVLTMPKIGVVRSFAMNHMIHHRAQLGVYLRLVGVPVPGTYGPSADEM